MNKILNLLTVVVGVSVGPTFASPVECERTIVSEDDFVARPGAGARVAGVIAEGPSKAFGKQAYRSLTVDGEPLLYFRPGPTGLMLRWDGRASVAALRAFAMRLLDGVSDPSVTATYYNESDTIERTGPAARTSLYAMIWRSSRPRPFSRWAARGVRATSNCDSKRPGLRRRPRCGDRSSASGVRAGSASPSTRVNSVTSRPSPPSPRWSIGPVARPVLKHHLTRALSAVTERL